ncbi:MAG: 4-hydroxy-3-methylbut-2-enyl diphosphate reductase [Psychromonas sp.]|jgi:4-hydroxy-3-methylbut-2-enyl diphosphate reductase
MQTYLCIRQNEIMKKFEIPEFYRSPIISAVKEKRKNADPRKKDFTPSFIDFGSLQFYIARHFGFCYGVENAIEISYKAIAENPDKRIFLLSQMIHNPGVNEELQSHGIKFLQDTSGHQLIDWSEVNADDIVIIPAFGTSVEIEKQLKQIGVKTDAYNTTCPFVEKVWNRAEKLGQQNHTIIIHGKHNHEETRATFSHSRQNAPSLILKDLKEAEILADFILGKCELDHFNKIFKGRYSENFDPLTGLEKIGVVNQTTMLATETAEITEFLKQTMIQKFGQDNIKNHIADTRDTLCYATNDNQSATYGLLEKEADCAIVVGGYNSSNTTHLVELLEQKFECFFISDESKINPDGTLLSYNIHSKKEELLTLPNSSNGPVKVIISSGASCPDAIVDRVMQKIIALNGVTMEIQSAVDKMTFG